MWVGGGLSSLGALLLKSVSQFPPYYYAPYSFPLSRKQTDSGKSHAQHLPMHPPCHTHPHAYMLLCRDMCQAVEVEFYRLWKQAGLPLDPITVQQVQQASPALLAHSGQHAVPSPALLPHAGGQRAGKRSSRAARAGSQPTTAERVSPVDGGGDGAAEWPEPTVATSADTAASAQHSGQRAGKRQRTGGAAATATSGLRQTGSAGMGGGGSQSGGRAQQQQVSEGGCL